MSQERDHTAVRACTPYKIKKSLGQFLVVGRPLLAKSDRNIPIKMKNSITTKPIITNWMLVFNINHRNNIKKKLSNL